MISARYAPLLFTYIFQGYFINSGEGILKYMGK